MTNDNAWIVFSIVVGVPLMMYFCWTVAVILGRFVDRFRTGR